MTWIKICGITKHEDAEKVAEAGADALGFIFANSPRQISPLEAKDIISELSPDIEKIGVFVNEEAEKVQEIVRSCGLTGIQLHGEESPEYCSLFTHCKVIKALRMKDELKQSDLDPYLLVGSVDSILLDTYVPGLAGGTGTCFTWDSTGQFAWRGKPVIIAGGLNPGNVRQALLLGKAQGVDVSSGVELVPREKDLDKVREFINQVRGSAK